jgi:hypothetical protein
LDLQCLFLNNAGNLFIEIVIYAIAKLIILGFTVATAKNKIWHPRFSKVNGTMNFGFLVEFLAAI